MGCGASKKAKEETPGAAAESAPAAAAPAENNTPAPAAEPAAPAVNVRSDALDALDVVFAQFDTDNSGDLSIKELKRALKALGVSDAKTTAESYFETLDENKDGKISLQEWKNSLPKELEELIISKLNDKNMVDGFRPLADLAIIFEQLDTDESGGISVKELKRALKALEMDKNDEMFVELFQKMEEREGEEISKSEFTSDKFLPKKMLQQISAKLNERGLISGFKDDGRDRKEKEGKSDEADTEAAAAAAEPDTTDNAEALPAEESANPAAEEEAAAAAAEAEKAPDAEEAAVATDEAPAEAEAAAGDEE